MDKDLAFGHNSISVQEKKRAHRKITLKNLTIRVDRRPQFLIAIPKILYKPLKFQHLTCKAREISYIILLNLQWLSIENQQGCDKSDVSFILSTFPKNFWNKCYLI